MLEKVISGGQTGADQAGWRAAKAAGIATGGWMPKGFPTEDGPRPEFAELYGAQEHTSDKYPPRTYANVKDSHATIWFGTGDSRGFGCTIGACEKIGRPYYVVNTGRLPSEVAEFLNAFCAGTVNIAGNRESMAPGIGERVERFLWEVFRMLKTP